VSDLIVSVSYPDCGVGACKDASGEPKPPTRKAAAAI
jgi:hypothetical protein